MNLNVYVNDAKRIFLELKKNCLVSEYEQNLIRMEQIIILTQTIIHHLPSDYTYKQKMDLIDIGMCFKGWKADFDEGINFPETHLPFIENTDNLNNIYNLLLNAKKLSPKDRYLLITDSWLSTVKGFKPY